MDWLVRRIGGSSQAHRAQNRLGRRCGAALKRDGAPVPSAAGELVRLSLPGFWRGELLSSNLPKTLLDCEDLTPLERDLASTALANAFEMILRPWFTGETRLNYSTVRRGIRLGS